MAINKIQEGISGQQAASILYENDIQAVQSAELFTDIMLPQTIIWRNGYFPSAAASLDTPVSVSSGTRSSQAFDAYYGMTVRVYAASISVFQSNSAGKLANAAGVFVKNLLPSEFTEHGEGAGKYFEITLMASEPFNRLVITAVIASVVKVEFSSSKIRPQFLDPVAVGALAASSGVLVSKTELFETGVGPVSLSWLGGYYSTSSTSLSTPITASDILKSSNPLPVPSSGKIKIQGVTPDAFSNSIGKLIGPYGTFVKNLTKVDDLIAVEDGFEVTTSGVGATSFLITLHVVAQDTFVLLSDTYLIKPQYLPADQGAGAAVKLLTARATGLATPNDKKLFIKGGIATVADNVLDFILSAGQSNDDGRAALATAPAWLTSNDNKLNDFMMWNRTAKAFQSYQLGVNTGANTNTETRHAFDLYVAKHYIDARGRKLYAVKCSLGGTSISPAYTTPAGWWTPYYEDFAVGKRKLILELAQRVRDAYAYAAENNLILNLRAVIWHQGESDASNATARDSYYQNMKDVIAYIRGVAMNPELPFIMGTIPDASESFNSVIRNAQETIAAEDDNAYLARLDDLELFDGLHFNGPNAAIAGTRYWDILKELI